MEKLVLIDGHSILNRAFYGVPNLTNSEGLHTNAVYGFLNILFKVLDEEKADYLAVAFDLKAPTFRHKMFDAYKGTRKPMPEELHEQVPLMKEVLTAMGVPILTKEGYEADDILGTIAKREQKDGYEVTILSGDRDLLQLSDTHIRICLPKTSRGTTEVHNYYPEDVIREYQVTPEQFIEVKALMGDQSDNIPGVPSIGEKTATSLIVQYQNLENIYTHLDEVKPPRAKKALEEHRDLAELSLKLARICVDAPIEFSMADAKLENLYTPEAYEYMKRLEFKSIAARFGEGIRNESGPEKQFVLVEDFSEADALFEKAKKEERIGMELLAENGSVTALALSFEETGSYTFPVGGFMTESYIAGKYEELCRTGHVWVLDLKHSLPFAKLSYGDTVYDAGVAAYLLNPLKDTYGYDDIARDVLGMTVPSRADLIKKMSYKDACSKEQDNFTRMAGLMAYTAFAAGKPLSERLAAEGMEDLYRNIELPLIYTLFHMEDEGIAVRREELTAYGGKLKKQIAVLEKEIWEMTGQEFNINSPKQLGEILFEKMQIKGGKKTKTGFSTSAEVLEKLAGDYPIVADILEYRKLSKLKSTYADGLSNFIDATGKIHTTFHQTITATGRLSSTDPNLQNIPIRIELGKMIRKVFHPMPGDLFVDSDYSQIELRLLAHMSGDEQLIEAFRENQDIHRSTASKVFHVPFDEVTDLQRRNAKAVNFGIVYGISAYGLSQDLNIGTKEAQGFIDSYFETYPKIKEFLDNTVAQAKEKGYTRTLFGRIRPIPELSSGNFMTRQFGERVAMNAPIQGTAADIIKIAMIRVHDRLIREHFRSRLILQVHDELLIETAEEEKEKVIALLEEEMQKAAGLKVELAVGTACGQDWYEAH